MNVSNSLPVLCIVIPCYNEEAVLPITSGLFLGELADLVEEKLVSDESRILFVDDGSNDATWKLIRSLAESNVHYTGISLSRNRGHQNALLAGLMEAREFCDISISIDCDGQDDVRAMKDMVIAYHDGCDVVYGVRSSRKADSLFKRTSAEGFYKLLNKMGVEAVFNHADYRLLSKRVLEEFSHFEEVNLFLRGMVPLVGFRSSSVYYERHERIAGESHYPLKKMVALALNGITSLSTKPIRIITMLGFFISILSLIGVIWAFVVLLMGKSVAGWASMVSLVCFMGGIQMLSLGIIGEYVGKIYMETKHRPRYIISERTSTKF
ncbi:glycosyltransferase family 2 protein [Gordonibacter massiliensis (ex Traore et al. 2017)]|nr:glycosyltransferase family 2 protein [Gordonibacter massiliensis (ex Traore et al. 2017)]